MRAGARLEVARTVVPAVLVLVSMKLITGHGRFMVNWTISLHIQNSVFGVFVFFELMPYLETFNDVCLFFSGLVDETD